MRVFFITLYCLLSIHLIAQNCSLFDHYSYYQKGKEYYQEDKIKEALKAFKCAIESASTLDVSKKYNQVGKAYRNIGILYADELHQYNNAINAYNQSIKYFSINNDKDVAKVYKPLARLLDIKGEYREAIKYYTLASKIFEENRRDKEILERLGECYIDLGIVYQNLKEYSQSMLYFEKALKIFKNLSNPIYQAQIYNNTGRNYLETGDYEKALGQFNLAIQYGKNDTALNLLNYYTNLGTSQTSRGNYQTALANYQTALVIAHQLSKSEKNKALALIYDNLADLYQVQQKFDTALHYYQKAIVSTTPTFSDTSNLINNPNPNQLQQSPHKTDLLTYLTDKANCQKKIGQFQQALNTFKATDQLIDLMRQDHSTEASKLFWRKTTHPTYEAALEICYELEDPRQAFYFMEKSRSALLLDHLRDYEGAEQQLSTPNEALYDDLLELHETDIVEFFVGKNSIFALKLDTAYPIFVKIERTSSLDSSFKKFIQELKNEAPNAEKYASLAIELHEKLIAPLKLKYKKLIIIRDGYFNYLPFESLITHRSESEHLNDQAYLLLQHSISYDYSAALVLKNIRKKTAKQANFFAIAPNQFPDFEKLVDLKSDSHLANLVQFFSKSMILKGVKATKQAFLEQIQGFNIINLTTHGNSDNDLPRIYFRNDSLTLPELFKLKSKSLEADLIVLGACETGAGKLIEGEGVMSFARGFAFSGITSTVANLWTVDVKSNHRIIEYFYKYLSQGLFKDEALQKAKIDYLKETDALNGSPYHWAALTCIGDIQPLHFYRHYFWAWITFGFFCSLFILFLKFRTSNNSPIPPPRPKAQTQQTHRQ